MSRYSIFFLEEIRGCVLQGKDYKARIQSYRITVTGQPPAKLMLRYEPRTELPGMEKTVQSKKMRQARDQDRRNKLEMKRRCDKVQYGDNTGPTTHFCTQVYFTDQTLTEI